MRKYYRLWLAYPMLALTAGCGRDNYYNERAERIYDMKQLGLLYFQHIDTHKRPPAGPEELRKFATNPEELRALRALEGGRVEVIWNVRVDFKRKGISETILAYEKVADTHGVRALLFEDGSHRSLPEDEFRAAPKSKPSP
jgi:hypothetical protein